ncbi:hypothetical protein B0H13DRAFT_1853553 [Mycena leptocephala]|nr:hypothetical protein B0H13DRAFT_1853553 [Mycena leptocephala]
MTVSTLNSVLQAAPPWLHCLPGGRKRLLLVHFDGFDAMNNFLAAQGLETAGVKFLGLLHDVGVTRQCAAPHLEKHTDTNGLELAFQPSNTAMLREVEARIGVGASYAKSATRIAFVQSLPQANYRGIGVTALSTKLGKRYLGGIEKVKPKHAIWVLIVRAFMRHSPELQTLMKSDDGENNGEEDENDDENPPTIPAKRTHSGTVKVHQRGKINEAFWFDIEKRTTSFVDLISGRIGGRDSSMIRSRKSVHCSPVMPSPPLWAVEVLPPASGPLLLPPTARPPVDGSPALRIIGSPAPVVSHQFRLAHSTTIPMLLPGHLVVVLTTSVSWAYKAHHHRPGSKMIEKWETKRATVESDQSMDVFDSLHYATLDAIGEASILVDAILPLLPHLVRRALLYLQRPELRALRKNRRLSAQVSTQLIKSKTAALQGGFGDEKDLLSILGSYAFASL